MELFEILLAVTIGLCTLVAGFLFAFAVVVMPGIRALSDAEFLRAFQVMDRVIQNRQPAFMVVWIGSVAAILVTLGVGFGELDDTGRALMIAAALVYLLGVQLPTMVINFPLNKMLQRLEVTALDKDEQAAVRGRFETRWNASNVVRTVLASVASFALILQLLRS